MANENLRLAPPWGSQIAWREVHGSIGYHIDRYQISLQPVVMIARRTRAHLESIFELLDDLSTETCFRCPDPCCLTASPWFDLRDLIYLHLNCLRIPSSQTIDAHRSDCRYLSAGGCTLSRSIRPWICTWYLCPVQTVNLEKRRPVQYENFKRTVKEIKMLRRQLEDAFIRVIV